MKLVYSPAAAQLTNTKQTRILHIFDSFVRKFKIRQRLLTLNKADLGWSFAFILPQTLHGEKKSSVTDFMFFYSLNSSRSKNSRRHQ